MAETSQKKVMVTLPVLVVGGTGMQTLSMIRVLIAAGYKEAHASTI